MKILLDTHILLWALTDDSRLGNTSRLLIDNTDNYVYYSAASIWELAIKQQIHPDKIPFSVEDIIRYCDDAGFMCLNINLWHAAGINNLRVRPGSVVSNDPFDRILVSQAKCESMPFLTHDKLMQYYDEPCIMMD